MKLETLLHGIPYTVVQTGDVTEIGAVVIDSRQASQNGLFICLRGFQTDGHRYIEAAAAAGAAAVLIETDRESYPPGLTVVKVADTRWAMSCLAATFYGHPARALTLIGVTGTNGKTSTTHFIETLLEAAGYKAGVIGTIGARLGKETLDIPMATATTPDPLELQQMLAALRDEGATHVVMEVSSHALHLQKTVGLTYEVGVFTNLTQDHLDFHGDMDSYRAAKARLFTQSRVGVLNADDPSTAAIRGELSRCITYGLETSCDLRASRVEYTAEGVAFDLDIDGASLRFTLPVKGRFNVYNALAAIGALVALGADAAVIQAGAARIQGVPGRIQAVPNTLGAHIIIDYAHTPDGLFNVINAVRAFTDGRVITLFGCGGDKDKTKRPAMGRVTGELSDLCIVTSDNPRSEDPLAIIRHIEDGLKETPTPYTVRADRREAIFAGIGQLQAGDALIIAGKGHETYQIIGEERVPFDDYQVALDALRASCG